jgi:hypothetical protein
LDNQELRPEPELTIMDGDRLEAFIDNGTFFCTFLAIHGRAAARAYAYSIAAEDPKTARAILQIVGREG